MTSYILYTEIKAKNQFTSLINACVSHELRNPLNSIIAKNIEKTALYQLLQAKLESLGKDKKYSSEIDECLKIMKELNEGKKVQ